MARLNSMLAALAAASLTLAQPAAAAARTGSPIGESEAATEGPGGELVMFILGFIGLVFVIMAITDDNDGGSSGSPSSP